MVNEKCNMINEKGLALFRAGKARGRVAARINSIGARALAGAQRKMTGSRPVSLRAFMARHWIAAHPVQPLFPARRSSRLFNSCMRGGLLSTASTSGAASPSALSIVPQPVNMRIGVCGDSALMARAT